MGKHKEKGACRLECGYSAHSHHCSACVCTLILVIIGAEYPIVAGQTSPRITTAKPSRDADVAVVRALRAGSVPGTLHGHTRRRACMQAGRCIRIAHSPCHCIRHLLSACSQTNTDQGHTGRTLPPRSYSSCQRTAFQALTVRHAATSDTHAVLHGHGHADAV